MMMVGGQPMMAPGTMSAEAMQEEEENRTYAAVAEACMRIQHLEKEWDSEKLQKKILEYLKKAAKNSRGGSKPWQQSVEDFANKYFECFSNACGDRPWLDQADFSACIGSAIKAYMTPGIVDNVPQEEYMQVVRQMCTIAHDGCRYYSYAWEPIKKIVPNKVAQKKVREAIDAARENVVKQAPGNVDVFITSWVQLATDMLAKTSAQSNPKISLSEPDALRLYKELVQNGCGVPLWLENAYGGKLPPNSPQVPNAVALAYSSYPDPKPRMPPCGKAGGKGKDGGFGAWGDGGGGGWGDGFGKGCGGFDPFAALAACWDSWGGEWGGCKGGDAWNGGKGGDAWGGGKGMGKGFAPY